MLGDQRREEPWRLQAALGGGAKGASLTRGMGVNGGSLLAAAERRSPQQAMRAAVTMACRWIVSRTRSR